MHKWMQKALTFPLTVLKEARMWSVQGVSFLKQQELLGKYP